MKKLFLGLGIASLIGFTACEDKTETVIKPDAENGALSFELYQPEDVLKIYTLLEEDENKVVETLTFAKPDYGFNSIPTYSAEVSLDRAFSKGHTQLLQTASKTEAVELINKELNSAILSLHALGDYPELTEAQQVFIRIRSSLSDATNGPLDPTPVVKPIYSNEIQMTVIPYEMTQVALPATYYLIGLGGNWDNAPTAIGSSLIPLSLIPEYPYDPTNGKGEFVYTGYFDAKEGFKVIGTPGDWADAWGMQDGEYVYGQGDNITVPVSGYYQVTLNTVTNELSIDPAKVDFTPNEWIEMVGDFSGWDAAPVRMTALEASKGSVWVADLTLDEDSGVKFRADGAWEASWGGKTFPYSLHPSGDNIPALAGEYKVVFNQIDNCYFFFRK